MQQLDKLYRDFLEKRKPCSDGLVCKEKSIIAKRAREEYVSQRSLLVHEEHILTNTTKEEKGKKEKKTARFYENKRGFYGQAARERSYTFAEKMKELEIMDKDNMDHVLDIQEVMHHYSRLTCPVYLDIVDKYFAGMCSEFFNPQPTVHVHNSMRRFHNVKL